MMKKEFWITTALMFSLTLGYAQPPEDMPALEVQEMSDEERKLFGTEQSSPLTLEEQAPAEQEIIEDDSLDAEVIEVPKLPVGEPREETVKMTQEIPTVVQPVQTSGTPLTADFAIAINPIGYDSVNLTGGNSETSRFFFQLAPSVALNTDVMSSKGTKTNISASYALNWREYLNKGSSNKRDFDHDATLSLTHQWTENVSTNLFGEIYYFFKTGDDLAWDNALIIFATPSVTIAAQDNLSFTIGYTAKFLDLIDARTSDVPGGDPEDFQSPGLSNARSTLDGDPALSEESTIYWTENWLNLGTSWSPMKGTNLGLTVNYNFIMFSNDSSMEWWGFYITPKYSQSLWEGGNFSFKMENRIRNYTDNILEGTVTNKQTFRYRFTFALSQAINDNITWNGFYRLHLEASNGDDFDKLNDAHWFYTGITYEF